MHWSFFTTYEQIHDAALIYTALDQVSSFKKRKQGNNLKHRVLKLFIIILLNCKTIYQFTIGGSKFNTSHKNRTVSINLGWIFSIEDLKYF